MKITISFILVFCLFTGKELLAQDPDITGTWKLEGDQLTYGFVIEGVQRDFVWGFEFKDEVIHLKRSSPDGSTTVVNSLKRK